MTGNSFGQAFRLTTFGESHGTAVGGVIDGCPAGMALAENDIQIELDRRRPGASRYTSQRNEKDKIQLLSGIFQGKTMGTPIAFIVANNDAKTKDYSDLQHCFRPGHADYSYFKKYGRRDYRGGGRASARETVARVAAGAVAKKYLYENLGIVIRACLQQVGNIVLQRLDWSAVNSSPFFSPDPEKLTDLEAYINAIRKAGDSIGAAVYVEALNVPAGLGEPVFDKLDADIASAMISIPAVKAVEIGAGFGSVEQRGSEHRDEITPQGFLTNHAGGVLGGITTGQNITLSIALKPAASIRLPAMSLDEQGQAVMVEVTGRHDPCVGIRAVPIAEAMLALVIMDHFMRNRAQNS